MTTLETVGNISNFFGVLGGIVAAVASTATWFGNRRATRLAQEAVKIVLRIGENGRQIVLPLEILRRDVSRAELLGRIGMIPVKKAGSRFTLREIGSPAVMRSINAVSRGETSVLVIPATADEVDQFDL